MGNIHCSVSNYIINADTPTLLLLPPKVLQQKRPMQKIGHDIRLSAAKANPGMAYVAMD